MKDLLVRIVALLLRMSLLGVVFLGSCVGLAGVYHESPHWVMAPITADAAAEKNRFFVAYVAGDANGARTVHAAPWRTVRDRLAGEVETFHMPATVSRVDTGGEGSITVYRERLADDAQLMTVHAVGDTPWVSVSEYEVRGETVVPRRLGLAVGWLLLVAAIAPLLLVYCAQKPVARLVRRMLPVGGAGGVTQ